MSENLKGKCEEEVSWESIWTDILIYWEKEEAKIEEYSSGKSLLPLLLNFLDQGIARLEQYVSGPTVADIEERLMQFVVACHRMQLGTQEKILELVDELEIAQAQTDPVLIARTFRDNILKCLEEELLIVQEKNGEIDVLKAVIAHFKKPMGLWINGIQATKKKEKDEWMREQVWLERLDEKNNELNSVKQGANIDHLTEILNRRGGEDAVFELIELSVEELSGNQRETDVKTTRGMAFFMIDIDHFKAFNDQYGHIGGDVALKAFARMLHDELPKECKLFRFGGEEFAVAMQIHEESREEERVSPKEVLRSVLTAMPSLSGYLKNEKLLDSKVEMTTSIGAYVAGGEELVTAYKEYKVASQLDEKDVRRELLLLVEGRMAEGMTKMEAVRQSKIFLRDRLKKDLVAKFNGKSDELLYLAKGDSLQEGIGRARAVLQEADGQVVVLEKVTESA